MGKTRLEELKRKLKTVEDFSHGKLRLQPHKVKVKVPDVKKMGDKIIRMYSPPHPGVFLKEEIIEPFGLTVTDAAKVLGVTRPALSHLLNGKASLSPEMALRFEKAFGLKMDTLLRMQTSYDIAQTRKTANKIKVERYEART